MQSIHVGTAIRAGQPNLDRLAIEVAARRWSTLWSSSCEKSVKGRVMVFSCANTADRDTASNKTMIANFITYRMPIDRNSRKAP